jgi:general secretion pathway protein M
MIEQWRNNVWVRRGAFVLANLAAFAGFLILFAWPIQAFFADREAQIAEQRVLLIRLNAIASQRATVERLAAQSATDVSRGEFLEGANDGVAAANLQTLLKGMVEPTGARLRSVRALPTKLAENIKFIGVQLEMTGTIRAVYQAIHTVETAKPLLFVAGALLKPTQQTAARLDASSAEPTIDAQLDVVGAMQIDGAE